MTLSLWKTVQQFLLKLNMKLLCDPAIIVLGICPREMKIYGPTKPLHEFLKQFYLNNSNWTQGKCLASKKWLAIYSVPIPSEYYSIIKKSKLLCKNLINCPVNYAE